MTSQPKHSVRLFGLCIALLLGLLVACNTPEPDSAEPTPAPADALMITGPSNGAKVAVNSIMVTGILSQDANTLSYALNGGSSEAVTLVNNEYSFWLQNLGEGDNTLVLSATWTNGMSSSETLNFSVDTQTSTPVDLEQVFYVANNGDSNQGEVDVFTAGLELLSTFAAGNNEGLALDSAGNLYQAGDTARGSSIRVIANVAGRTNGSFDSATDHEISGDQTRLKAPKGLAVAEAAGYIIVADFGEDANSENLKVFAAEANGNVAPVGTTKLGVKPWDVAYDGSADRLFVALTNGTVAVFDSYTTDFGAGGPNRTFKPVDRRSEKISDNFHGIAYSADMDSLVLSDVGAATTAAQTRFNSDGGIYVINNASTAFGSVRAARSLFGPSTKLGNPVDLILVGTEARIAEKANDKLLVYNNIFFGDSGDIQPDLMVDELKPESLVASLGVVLTEADDALEIYLSTNGPTNAGNIETLDEGFALSNTFVSGNNEGVDIDSAGTLYHAGDTIAGEGSIKIIFDIHHRSGSFGGALDREISGSNTGLIAPKGLLIATNYIVVADFGAKNLKTFTTAADGNIAPVATAPVSYGEFTPSVWDATYDSSNDIVYASLTNGKIAVFRNFTSNFGVDGPDTILYPVDSASQEIADNLHGIAYSAEFDALVVSDVGTATTAAQPGFDTDGSLYVFNDISSVSTPADLAAGVWLQPDRWLEGPATLLGNPVDLVITGSDVRIAEKAGDKLLVFSDLFTGSDSAASDLAPTLAVDKVKPESLVAVADPHND